MLFLGRYRGHHCGGYVDFYGALLLWRAYANTFEETWKQTIKRGYFVERSLFLGNTVSSKRKQR